MNAPKPGPTGMRAPTTAEEESLAKLQGLTSAAVSLERLASALHRLRRAEGSGDREFANIYAQEIHVQLRRTQRDVIRLASGGFRERLVELTLDEALDGLADALTGAVSQTPSVSPPGPEGTPKGADAPPFPVTSEEVDHSLRGSVSASSDLPNLEGVRS